MKNLLLLLVAALCTIPPVQAQVAVPVFVSGNSGYQSFRIPAIIQHDGRLLAFAEGRVHDADDFGNIDIVMKTSEDGGRSWSALQVIIDAAALQAGNPAPVVDMTDPQFPGGRIFLFYNTGNNTELEVRKGNGLREVWYVTSTDLGRHWSAPMNITTQAHRPRQPQLNPEYNFSEDWRSYANTPGHAIQFMSGRFRSRIFIAANHSTGDPQPDYSDYQAHGFFSDDHGKSFQLGAVVSVPGSNESMAAELTGDKLMMNSRNQRGDIRARIVSVSSDGGRSWDTSYFDHRLPDPVCQGSLLSFYDPNQKHVLVFCNDADTAYRNQLTLRVSRDEGKSWIEKHFIDQGVGTEADHTAYSDLVVIKQHQIGVLYERDDYKEIAFKVLPLVTQKQRR